MSDHPSSTDPSHTAPPADPVDALAALAPDADWSARIAEPTEADRAWLAAATAEAARMRRRRARILAYLWRHP